MEKFDKENFVEKKVFRNGRNYVAAGEYRGQTVVAKRFGHATWANRLIYTWLRKTKGERAYANARMLLAKGFLTPEPIAWCVEKSHGIYACGWYVCAWEQCKTLGEEFEQASDERKKQLVELYADTMCRLIEQGILFEDSNLGNFLIVKDQNGKEALSLVDINRLKTGQIRPLDVLSAFGRTGFEAGIFQSIAAEYCRRSGNDYISLMARYERLRLRNQMRRRLKKSLLHPFRIK